MRHYDHNKLLALVEEVGSTSVVCDAYRALHGVRLPMTTLQYWMHGQREPGVNGILSLCDVFGVPLSAVLSDGPPVTYEAWYAVVSRRPAKGPKPKKGPYGTVELARRAVTSFRIKHGTAVAAKQLRTYHSTIVGPFSTRSRAAAAKFNSTPLVEACWS